MKRQFVCLCAALAASVVLAEAGSTFAVGHVPVKIKDTRPPMSVYTDAWATNVESVALFARACQEYRARGDLRSLAAFAEQAMARTKREGAVYGEAYGRRYGVAVALKDEPIVRRMQAEIAARPFDRAVQAELNAAADLVQTAAIAQGAAAIDCVMAPVMDGRADAAFVQRAQNRAFLLACAARQYDEMAKRFEAARGPRGGGADRHCSHRYLERLAQRLMFATAEPIAAEGLKHWPDDFEFARDLAVSRLALGRWETVADTLAPFVVSTNLPPEKAFVAKALAAVAGAKEPSDAKTALTGLRKGCADDRDYVTLMHSALQVMLPALMTDRHTEYLRAARAALETCLHEEERVVARIRYLKSAPRSAEGAELLGVFDLPWAEHRFGKYGVYANCRGNSDFTKLRDQPRPDLEAMKGEGRSGDLVAAYDETGVHFYVRFRHPDAAKFKFGESGGAYMEFSVMPGTETGYHQVFLQSGEVNELNEIEWDPVDFGHRRTRGTLLTDQAVADTAFLFHVFVPWTAVYTRLPKDGDAWLTVLLADTPDGSYALGGGIGHEFGRGGRFVFDLPDERAQAIRRAVIRRSAVDYVALRGKFENLQIWSDRDLGDPEFHAARLRDWVAELDAAAKTVGESDALTDEAFIARFEPHLRDWADFRLSLDAKRAAWLEEGLFKDE